MKTYRTVEDYLEVLAGYRDPITGNPSSTWFFGFDPIISLANYDVKVLTSMSEATIASKPLTEKQGALLCNVLLKYQRQFASKSIDVTPVSNPVWRVKLRKMDYTRRIGIANDKIVLRFPYHNEMIEDIRTFKRTSQGACEFDMDSKQWNIALTEYNLNWLYTWASKNEFEIDSEVTLLNDLILDMESTPYAMELVVDSDVLRITNCPDSLRDYIENTLGGFGLDNLLTLIDAASVLGYTYESDLDDVVIHEWGEQMCQLANGREVRIDPNSPAADGLFSGVLEYASKVNRLPVVIYEPDLSDRLLKRLKDLYPEDQIYASGLKKVLPELPPTVKFIHTHKPIRNMDRIPLLVSGVGMIFGGDKQHMMQRSEKVVYLTSAVYNAKDMKVKSFE